MRSRDKQPCPIPLIRVCFVAEVISTSIGRIGVKSRLTCVSQRGMRRNQFDQVLVIVAGVEQMELLKFELDWKRCYDWSSYCFARFIRKWGGWSKGLCLPVWSRKAGYLWDFFVGKLEDLFNKYSYVQKYIFQSNCVIGCLENTTFSVT